MGEPIKIISEALFALIRVKVPFDRLNAFWLDDGAYYWSIELGDGGTSNKRQRLPYCPAELATTEVRVAKCIGDCFLDLELFCSNFFKAILKGVIRWLANSEPSVLVKEPSMHHKPVKTSSSVDAMNRHKFLNLITITISQQSSLGAGRAAQSVIKVDNSLFLLIGGILFLCLLLCTITRRMTTIEEMEGTDVLCSDKTRTLTLNKLIIDRNLIKLSIKGMEKEHVILLTAGASRIENQIPLTLPLCDPRYRLSEYRFELVFQVRPPSTIVHPKYHPTDLASPQPCLVYRNLGEVWSTLEHACRSVMSCGKPILLQEHSLGAACDSLPEFSQGPYA
ncbi:hypothetical protein AAG906_003120 [Vitis piasezkii]